MNLRIFSLEWDFGVWAHFMSEKISPRKAALGMALLSAAAGLVGFFGVLLNGEAIFSLDGNRQAQRLRLVAFASPFLVVVCIYYAIFPKDRK